MKVSVVIIASVVMAACGSDVSSKAKEKWLAATWTATEGDFDGTHFSVEIPAGILENTESKVGKDWWSSGDAVLGKETAAGPRLTLMWSEQAFADADALARDVDPEPDRSGLVVIAKGATADGRLRYSSAVKDNRHIAVHVWTPLDAIHGVHCRASWWSGGPARKDPPPPDPAIVAWLDRFCAGLKLRPVDGAR